MESTGAPQGGSTSGVPHGGSTFAPDGGSTGAPQEGGGVGGVDAGDPTAWILVSTPRLKLTQIDPFLNGLSIIPAVLKVFFDRIPVKLTAVVEEVTFKNWSI